MGPPSKPRTAPGTATRINSYVGKPPIKDIKIKSVTFTTDHHVMLDNDSDWKFTGALYPKPEWTPKGKKWQNKPKKLNEAWPISHSKHLKVGIKIELEIEPPNARATIGKITGVGEGGFLHFAQSGITFHGGSAPALVLTSLEALPDKIEALESKNIAWGVELQDGRSLSAGSSGPHTLYVTHNTPIHAGGGAQPEEGATQKRMAAAVHLVGSVGSNKPHKIVEGLMGQFSGYRLRPDLAIPAAYNDPQYFNTVGGAWPLYENLKKNAECQAIVRFVRGAIEQVGCPGTVHIMLVYAKPEVAAGATALEDDFEKPNGGGLGHYPPKVIDGKLCQAALVDAYPTHVGQIFQVSDPNLPDYIGLNNFEACLKFVYGGETKYYGGGAGNYDTLQEVIFAFQALVWVQFLPPSPGPQKVRIAKIVRRYRNAAGDVIP